MAQPPFTTTAAALHELSAVALSTESVDELLHEVTVLVPRVITEVDSCGITLAREAKPTTVASNDEAARQVDELQYTHDAGPCLQALRQNTIVDVPDMADENRWAKYPLSAVSQGIRAVLSLPLTANGTTLGAMNLYAQQPRSWTRDERELAQLFANQASAFLASMIRYTEQAELSRQFQEALTSRSTIDQAIGIIMNQNGCSPVEGFDLLRQASNHRNTKLRDIAAAIVTARSATTN